MRKYKLGIIGCGNMSTAIWKGIINSGLIVPNDIAVSDIDSVKLIYAAGNGIANEDNLTIATECDYVLFAVKPQCFPDIAVELKGKLNCKMVLSIMAGISIAKLEESLGITSICRIMPNTPCMVCKGMSALCYQNCSDGDRSFAKSIFNIIGKTIEIEEEKFDAVTSVSGSGPAYVYMFMQGMINEGINGGLTYLEALQLTAATLQGASELALTSDKTLEELTDAVCSKGGTTIEAVNVYKKENLVGIVQKGVEACRNRSLEMSGKKKILKDETDVITEPNAQNMKKVVLYTDGACSVNPGPGGWAAILCYGDAQKEFSGSEKDTTNNRMELMGVISGLQALKYPCEVELYSDSAYVVNAITNGWVYGWKKKNWRTSANDEVKNIDLWETLLNLLTYHNVTFNKVKGHADNEMNNRCDKLARDAVAKIK